ncbi:MAG: hypothetical protein KC492_21620, partial [Myxococcales bacterium]|nr:hypothetical protein [Myxococcales bacterium]
RLAEQYPTREFALQYRESDFAFVSRLMEHWGIAFSFEHGTRDRVIFTDSNPAMLDIACWRGPSLESGAEGDAPENPSAAAGTTTTLQFTQFGGSEEAAPNSVVEHTRRTQRVPARFATQDYNYRLPHVRLEAEHSVHPEGDGRVVEHGLHPKLPEEVAYFAKIRAELIGCGRTLHRGTTGSLLMRAGGSFRLHPDSEGCDTSLLVHRVEFRLQGGFSARFYAQPLDVTYRPALLTPRPSVAGYLSGVIQGEDSARPNLDEQGRYQVVFNCEDHRADEHRPARRMRMLQSHAGPNYGMHFPLKPGTEVAVGFMNGDPDRPFIAGALPNPLTPSPVRAERSNVRRNVIQSMNGVRIELDDGRG